MKAQKILVVDDDLPSRMAMEKLLQGDGCQITSCESGVHAIEKLKEESFGILITDFQMPGMDGLQLIREARRVQPEISTVLVTGLAGEEMKLRAMGIEVDKFFPKPIEWDELVSFLDFLKRRGKDVVAF